MSRRDSFENITKIFPTSNLRKSVYFIYNKINFLSPCIIKCNELHAVFTSFIYLFLNLYLTRNEKLLRF